MLVIFSLLVTSKYLSGVNHFMAETSTQVQDSSQLVALWYVLLLHVVAAVTVSLSQWGVS